MEYKLNNDQSKKILALLILLIILVGIIGGLIFYTNNNKLVVMQKIDKVVNSVSDNIFGLFEGNKDVKVADINFKANLEQNSETGVKSNEILRGTIHSNSSDENDYKIINFNADMQGNNINGGIYEKDGYVYLKLNDVAYKVNDEKIEQIDYYSNIEDIHELSKIIYSVGKKQLNQLDFYKITAEENKKQTKYGLSLTDERIKEIIIDTANELKENEKFLTLYARINNIEKDEVVEKIDEYLKKLDEIEFSKDNITKLEIYTSGILDIKTDKIVITRVENSIRKFTADITIGQNSISAILEQGSNKTNISLSSINNRYDIDIFNDYFNINITEQKDSFELVGKYSEYNVYMKYDVNQEEDKITANGTISFNINNESKVVIVYDETDSFEEKKESVTLGEIKNINELMNSLMMYKMFMNY